MLIWTTAKMMMIMMTILMTLMMIKDVEQNVEFGVLKGVRPQGDKIFFKTFFLSGIDLQICLSLSTRGRGHLKSLICSANRSICQLFRQVGRSLHDKHIDEITGIITLLDIAPCFVCGYKSTTVELF